MGVIELTLIAVGLSMDAFAVSICKGLEMIKRNYKQAVIMALFFGVFQALMPYLGWYIGSKFSRQIESIDHWVAFILLGFVGLKMVREAFEEKDDCQSCYILNYKELFILAIATSIDAFAVGITFAFISNANIIFSVLFIGVVTFIFSFIGSELGHRLGVEFGSKAEIFGGGLLIGLGTKILIQHLFF